MSPFQKTTSWQAFHNDETSIFMGMNRILRSIDEIMPQRPERIVMAC